jgi:hypothetical protein
VELAFRPNLHTPDHKPNTMGCQAEPALLECAYERTEGQATSQDSLAPASHHAPKGASLLKAMMPIKLVETVKKLTGKPHTNDIATLLEAAYYAVGINEGVDPRNLKMLYRRRVPRKK